MGKQEAICKDEWGLRRSDGWCDSVWQCPGVVAERAELPGEGIYDS